MKKIIQTVADGGGELGVHMYPLKKSGCSADYVVLFVQVGFSKSITIG